HWQTSRKSSKRAGACFTIHAHHFFTLLIRLVLVFLLNLSQPGLDLLHLETRPHRTLVQRPERNPDEHTEDHEHPSIAQLQVIVQPEQQLDTESCNRIDYRLKEAPTIWIYVIEI